MEPAVGVSLSGHLLSEEIGRGGYSRVYRAEPPGGGPAVAVKVAFRRELVAALRSEGAVLRRLEGPRFVRILEEHLDEDPPFFVLELCPGGDLRGLLEREPAKRLPVAEVQRLLLGILEGIAFAHEEGVVHGDVKPENVLLDAQGEPKLADLGLSRAKRDELVARAGVVGSLETEDSRRVAGTIDYLPPEVRKGAPISPRSDVYALGVLAHELLVGTKPLGLFQLPSQTLAPEPVPPELDRLVARALAQDPLDRYADAGEMLQDLLAGAEGIPLTREQAPRAAGPNPLLVACSVESFADRALTILLFNVPLTLLCWGAALGAWLGGLADASDAGRAVAGGLAAFGFFWLAYAGVFLLPYFVRYRGERWLTDWRTRRALESAGAPGA